MLSLVTVLTIGERSVTPLPHPSRSWRSQNGLSLVPGIYELVAEDFNATEAGEAGEASQDWFTVVAVLKDELHDEGVQVQ